MTRKLRSRASRPNYAALFEGFEDEAGPSGANPIPVEDEDSGSDFELEAAQDAHVGEDEEPDDDDVDEDETMADIQASDESDVAVSTVSKRKRPAQTKVSANKRVVLPALSAARNRQTPLQAAPSQNHRHRAVQIYQKTGAVERLVKPPVLFGRDETVLTKSWGTPVVGERVNKSWGYNVGPGPLWELVEDRGWFPEALDGDTEASRRPKVHAQLPADTYEIISPSDAVSYLPSTVAHQNGGHAHAPPGVSCHFGPFGQQTVVRSQTFDTHRMADFIPNSRSHVVNVGAQAWGIDWCPTHSDDLERNSYKQYLAIGPLSSRDHTPHVGVKSQRPIKACIQIWCLRPSHTSSSTSVGTSTEATVNDMTKEDDIGEMSCEVVLCIDSGPAYDLKWCPLPSRTAIQNPRDAEHAKLGILAGTFADGSLCLYAVPDPTQIPGRVAGAQTPAFVQLSKPLLRIELEDTCFWTLDWASSEVLAVGCTNGSIAVYNIAPALKSENGSKINLLPLHYISVHQSAVRSLAWIRAPGLSANGDPVSDPPTVIASGGYDGVECLTDLRELAGSVLNRTRDVINAVTYSTYCGGPVTIDHENTVKVYSVTPSMLGRGHVLLEPGGPVWSIDASDYHPQLAIGATDGTCLTTNCLRGTRRGGSVPFLVHKIYQLDYNRNSGEFRMLENFFPQETQERPAAAKAKANNAVGTGAWPPEIGVLRVVWNDGNGLGRSPLLASSTGAGLCRIDWLTGRWHRERIPYEGIQGIRGEVGTGIYDDDESD